MDISQSNKDLHPETFKITKYQWTSLIVDGHLHPEIFKIIQPERTKLNKQQYKHIFPKLFLPPKKTLGKFADIILDILGAFINQRTTFDHIIVFKCFYFF